MLANAVSTVDDFAVTTWESELRRRDEIDTVFFDSIMENTEQIQIYLFTVKIDLSLVSMRRPDRIENVQVTVEVCKAYSEVFVDGIKTFGLYRPRLDRPNTASEIVADMFELMLQDAQSHPHLGVILIEFHLFLKALGALFPNISPYIRRISAIEVFDQR